MFRGSRIFVLLSPTRHELVVPGPRGTVRTGHVDPADAKGGWTNGLAVFQERLRAWVAELGLEGAPTVCLYSGPDVSASVQSCAAAAGAPRAARAAELAHRESIQYDFDSNPSASLSLIRDRRPSTNSDGSPRVPQLHTLVASDRETSSGSVSKALAEAGLRPVQLVPLPALAIQCALDDLRSATDAGGVHAVLWVGEHQSVLVAGDQDRLLLLRQLPLGTESLVDALCRPMRSDERGVQCVLLNRDAARHRLFSSGIPRSGQEAGPDGLDPALALPLLQSVFQRLSVEARNSLRFGLAQEDREALSTHLGGPGAGIPGLAEALRPDDRGVAPLPFDPAQLLSAASHSELNLLPDAELKGLQAGVLRRGLWAGVGVACLGVAADAFLTWQASTRQDQVVRTLRAENARPDLSRQALERTVSLQQGIALAHARLGAALRGSPEWSALMNHLAASTPEECLLSLVECKLDAGAWTCRITGTMHGAPGKDLARTLNQYVAALGAAPAVEHARLGATQRSRSGVEERLNFDAVLTLVPLPRDRVPILDERTAEAPTGTEETP